MKQNTLALIVFIAFLIMPMFILLPTVVIGAVDGADLSKDVKQINVDIQEKYFKDEVSGGLEGIGTYEGSKIGKDTNVYAKTNAMALCAFYTRYSKSGNAECDDWAENEILPAIQNLESNDKIERDDLSGVFYTADQGMVLEFLSVGYDESQNQEMLTLMEKIYSSIPEFEANETMGYNGYEGAYWRAINEDGIKYQRANTFYKYCFANDSLWALIGMLKFGISVKGLTIDKDEGYSESSVEIAEDIIEFLEDDCFHNGSGFLEYPEAQNVAPDEKKFYMSTQALAVLAYTRLYEATEEQVYLDKAKMMVEYIITKNFLDTGKHGGVVSWISFATGEKSNTKRGYDNALYAYALMNLYEVMGETDQSYLRRAEEIVVFMNDELYYESKDGEILGYAEILVDNSIPENREYLKFATNSLMMFVNEHVMWHERPWYIKYMLWLIIGAIVIAAIVFIAILVRRKRNIGRKLPKMVKGLVED
ncbi:MAG: glycoside hydrolase family 76 protein [Promethearchaeota archaeon]